MARLYEVYPGEPAVKTMALGKPEGFTTPPVSTPDLEPTWPGAVPAMERKYYRKIYIPGVGRPFWALGDSGNGQDATLGLAIVNHIQV